MSLHLRFPPERGRATELDRRMHLELAASLRHVVEQADGVISFDPSRVESFIADLEGGSTYPPTAFGRYYDLVASILTDDLEDAERILEELPSMEPIGPEPRVWPLGSLDHCPRSRLYYAKLSEGMSPGITIVPPGPEEIAVFEERYWSALDLLRQAVPDLAGEIEVLVREVVPVAGDPADTERFDGASHYQLWGGLFLNAEPAEDRVAMAERIAHESAHSFLFGNCVDEPLAHNDDEKLYPSPLRSDPRPMDGIYHATFVSARMHWAMSQLLESDQLSERERDSALAARDRDARNFTDGDDVIRAHADLSPTGAILIAGAREWMAASAA